MTAEVRAALRTLPPVGENSSGPLGPGLLASGQLGAIVRDLQVGLAESSARSGESPAHFCDGPLVRWNCLGRPSAPEQDVRTARRRVGQRRSRSTAKSPIGW
jgi:hypothetical protein